MKKIIADTNFLVYCAQKKIDFFEYCELNGFSVIIPEEVLKEIEKLSSSSNALLKKDFKVVKDILSKEKFKKVSFGGRYADSAIIGFLRKNPSFFLATMDEALQKEVGKNILKIRGKQFELFLDG
jgi:rRNA-processing protein FCF1